MSIVVPATTHCTSRSCLTLSVSGPRQLCSADPQCCGTRPPAAQHTPPNCNASRPSVVAGSKVCMTPSGKGSPGHHLPPVAAARRRRRRRCRLQSPQLFEHTKREEDAVAPWMGRCGHAMGRWAHGRSAVVHARSSARPPRPGAGTHGLCGAGAVGRCIGIEEDGRGWSRSSSSKGADHIVLRQDGGVNGIITAIITVIATPPQQVPVVGLAPAGERSGEVKEPVDGRGDRGQVELGRRLRT